MNAPDGIAAIALGGVLLYLATAGKADDLALLVMEDAPGFLKWGLAVVVLVWALRQLPGEIKEVGEALGIAALVGFTLVSGGNISKEIRGLFASEKQA